MTNKYHLENAPKEPVGEVETNIGKIALSDVDFLKNVNINDLSLSFNKVTVAPGGLVPLHSHNERPAIMFVVKGVITEFNSMSAEPRVHTAPSATIEYNDVEHWWKNESNDEVVIYSAMLV
ncbi:cupin domain-containing protein [Vibrio sp. Sgm 5]|uniref:cupin domain-containing protein n=1 Tax=Vibrio sp. Sgm 5 TaxID=2994387 RepID=UPI0022493916|nr:cupin domain-containing protein [Vibrio sp. Sgm 5]MCX2789543.1 hypothetical protein [Vibrio sp. Sgm 5]